jgi:hypothetical protein
MPERFGAVVLTIECPHCGSQMKEQLRNLSTSPKVRCATCESLLKVDGEQLKTALATLEAAAQAMCDGGVKRIGSAS